MKTISSRDLLTRTIHIESSMMPPSEFARIAVAHGTVAAVCDPHEIAQRSGGSGCTIHDEKCCRAYPLNSTFPPLPASQPPLLKPAEHKLTLEDTETLLEMPEIKFLGEMMNFPGVIYDDPEVLKKLEMAKAHHKTIDGHSPGLTGGDLKKYIAAGITTDHECFTMNEALEKLSLGMKILIREGSGVKNFDDLIPIADEYYQNCMFCSDDKHPDDLLKGHINDLVRRALHMGPGQNESASNGLHQSGSPLWAGCGTTAKGRLSGFSRDR